MRITVTLVALMIASPVPAQSPFPKGDGACPSSYVRSGGFCTPTSERSRPAVANPTGKACPSGWTRSGSACIRA